MNCAWLLCILVIFLIFDSVVIHSFYFPVMLIHVHSCWIILIYFSCCLIRLIRFYLCAYWIVLLLICVDYSVSLRFILTHVDSFCLILIRFYLCCEHQSKNVSVISLFCIRLWASLKLKLLVSTCSTFYTMFRQWLVHFDWWYLCRFLFVYVQ